MSDETRTTTGATPAVRAVDVTKVFGTDATAIRALDRITVELPSLSSPE
jgi:hypothetical protein